MTPTPAALELARRLAALPEPAMREHVLVEYLARTPPPAAVIVLAELYALGRAGGPPFTIALLAMVGVLSGETLCYERRVLLYAAAKEAGREALLRLFLSSQQDGEPVSRIAGERAAGAASDNAIEAPRELTLGHRKWLARAPRREVLDKLLRDPEPEVVPILLENPRLVERDVVLLAARRPTFAEVQWQVFGARRWIARYAVKRALVLNPYTPTELSIRLLGFLASRDLRFVILSPALPAPVRDAARLLRARPAGDGGDGGARL